MGKCKDASLKGGYYGILRCNTKIVEMKREEESVDHGVFSVNAFGAIITLPKHQIVDERTIAIELVDFIIHTHV